MEANQSQGPRDQLNPGQNDQFGNEVVIKKNEGISEQGNEWSDKEELGTDDKGLLGKKAEKYIKDSADVEDLPEQEDKDEADETLTKESAKNEHVVDDDDGENSDDVIEDEDDYIPGYDLGRNKVQ